MKIKKDAAANVATIMLDRNENLNLTHLDTAVQHVVLDPVGFWNLDLILDTRVMNLSTDALQGRGFVIAGNVSEGNTMSIRLRKRLRQSGDGCLRQGDPNLVMTAVHPGPTVEELSARETTSKFLEMRYNDAEVNARIAALQRRPEAME